MQKSPEKVWNILHKNWPWTWSFFCASLDFRLSYLCNFCRPVHFSPLSAAHATHGFARCNHVQQKCELAMNIWPRPSVVHFWTLGFHICEIFADPVHFSLFSASHATHGFTRCNHVQQKSERAMNIWPRPSVVHFWTLGFHICAIFADLCISHPFLLPMQPMGSPDVTMYSKRVSER